MTILRYLSIIALCTMSFAQNRDSDKMQDLSFKTPSGTTLKYLLFIPKNYDPVKKYPLVVTLHGAGSDNVAQVNNNDQAHPWIEDSIQAREPHFIMAPNCPGSTWGGMMGTTATSLSAEGKAVVDAIEDLKKKYSLDSNRFIICGFSIGGAGTYHLIQFKPDYWAAAVPCAAGGDSSKIEIIAKTPIWHHHGSNDNTGAALKRMSAALVSHNYPIVNITSTQVVNSQASWQKEITKGTLPKDIIFKNAAPSYDSVDKVIESGAKYLFLMFNGGDHESSRLNANHNPLVAKWALSKRKGGTQVTPFTVKAGNVLGTGHRLVLFNGNKASLNYVNNRVFTLQGRSDNAVQGDVSVNRLFVYQQGTNKP
ncbi:MAG TPA: prolyl oligopeptidase family serine peptidase [Chitinispirillaceae bacterium]|nr:prolyl oligopeptidase family serine peptidase [Chitinispirillaceae bacterium]